MFVAVSGFEGASRRSFAAEVLPACLDKLGGPAGSLGVWVHRSVGRLVSGDDSPTTPMFVGNRVVVLFNFTSRILVFLFEYFFGW